MKRYVVLLAAVLLMMAYGSWHAWSVFAKPLQEVGHLLAWQTQAVFTTGVLVFCLALTVAGRLHDQWGPRPLALASGLVLGGAYLLAGWGGHRYGVLWLAMGVLTGLGSAIGYVGPLATVAKWFPRRRGLACGLVAAGFAVGAIVMSAVGQALCASLPVSAVFRLVGLVCVPALLAAGMLLVPPPGWAPDAGAHERAPRLRGDPRFWALFVGMLSGTFPYLVVMGNVKALAAGQALGGAAGLAVACTAAGSASGRAFWGHMVDRIGQRRATLTVLALVLAALGGLALARGRAPLFLAAAALIGFCYGGNFSIYPVTVSRVYGTHVMGTVYPLVMLAQGVSALGPILNGALVDWTGSHMPGLVIAAVVALAGLGLTAVLTRRKSGSGPAAG